VALVSLAAMGAVTWAAAVGALGVWRHDRFLSHRYDLGNMVQAVWSTAHGRVLEMTDGTTGDQIVRLGAHVDPVLVLFAPLWWIHPAPETLIVAFAAVIAAGVYPVVRLGLRYTESMLGAGLLGAWYLAYPWTVWIALNELNPVMLALPLLLYAIWFLDEHRVGPFALFAGLAMLTGELIGLTVAMIGVWYAVRYHRPRVGLAVAAAGAAWTAICLAVVIPAFGEGESSRYYGTFESVGGSPLGLLETLVTDPGTVLAQVTTSGDVQYVLWLALPTALLFLAQPLLLLAAAPQLAVNLLSEQPSTVSPLYHYGAPLIAVLVAATIIAIGRLPTRFRVIAAGAPLVVAIVVLTSIPPRPGTEDYLFPSEEPPARVAALQHAVSLVPPTAPVSVTNRLGAQLSTRRTVHLFPAQVGAEWAVIDTRDPSNTTAKWIGPTPFGQLLHRLERDSSWRLVYESEGVRVYRTAIVSPPA
jgi:uncharacterized membrane protein